MTQKTLFSALALSILLFSHSSLRACEKDDTNLESTTPPASLKVDFPDDEDQNMTDEPQHRPSSPPFLLDPAATTTSAASAPADEALEEWVAVAAFLRVVKADRQAEDELAHQAAASSGAVAVQDEEIITTAAIPQHGWQLPTTVIEAGTALIRKAREVEEGIKMAKAVVTICRFAATDGAAWAREGLAVVNALIR